LRVGSFKQTSTQTGTRLRFHAPLQQYNWSFRARLSLSPGRPGRSSNARVERYKCSLQARSFSLQGWGLIDLPLRASNEGLLRPRVARAQKIIRLHPLLCFASRRTTRQPLFPFHTRMPSAFANVTGGARYPPRLSRDGRLELTKAPRSQDRGCGNSRRFPPG
jgi:hypothetical protein